MTEMLASGLFEVVEKGQVDSVLLAEAIDPGTPLDASLLRRLGQRLKVQAFLMGSIDSYGESRIGNSAYPDLTMSLRLVDSESGLVLWQASGRGTGYSLWGRLFGVGYKDPFRVYPGAHPDPVGHHGEAGDTAGMSPGRVPGTRPLPGRPRAGR